MKAFKLGRHCIGPEGPCLIVGEVAQAHEGSLGMAHAFIDAIAQSGADGVKFQTHIAGAESTAEEEFRVDFSPQDASRYDYWRRMEFTEEQWQGLATHARDRGLIFLSSPFSQEAVEMLIKVGVPAWKIASGEIGSKPIFERIVETGLPVLLSTGMSSWEEIDSAVQMVRQARLPYLVFQCTTAYPCPAEQIGLNLIPEMRERYGCPIGLSDHSGKIFPGLAAATLGIDMLEAHVTLSRHMFGPDVAASLTPRELSQLVEGVRYIEKMNAHPVDKDSLAKDLEPLRAMFFKSVVAAENLPAGTMLRADHLTIKKPGAGLPAAELETVIGRRLKRDVRKDQFIRNEDLI